ncbi:MAG: MCP four helix bundle domain-containing protein, partial [Lachnospiraceae bacterium]|nr:MCP four helix bundle domain-containing protein [Lachnospiraceae bacterium]
VYSSALETYGFAQGDVGMALDYFSETRSALRAAIGFDDPDMINSQIASHQEYKEKFETAFAEMESAMVSEANKEAYASIASKLPTYWEIDGRVMEIGAVTDRELCLQAQEIATDEMRPLYTEITEELRGIMDTKVARGNSQSTLLTILTIVLAVVIVAIIVGALTFSIRMGKMIAREIADPLTQLQDRLESFAQGDLSSPFPDLELDDEVADSVKAAQDMAETLNFIIGDIEYLLGEMANSNYAVRSRDGSKYQGEFQQIYESLRQLRNNMVETLRFIGESSIQVSAGSTNLAESSESLAEGATEQAGAVQELQNTITTIAGEAKKAADSAEQAYRQSQEYANVADRSSDDMKEMVEAMSRINETSQKIGNIISEIENIASETNLLSLNASIEAARAGEAGRGFSVVADQIRQLAEQSSKSAVDTRTLIEGAMSEIDNGNKVADRAVASLATVVEGIRKVADSSQELSVSSANQAHTMESAEHDVNQISDVIQTNAAIAEESSATSQELSAQAVSLDALIAKFTLPE